MLPLIRLIQPGMCQPGDGSEQSEGSQPGCRSELHITPS